MRRLARPLLYAGTFGIILLLGRVHAQYIGGYVFHQERLPWTVGYAVLLSLSAYAIGLPDLYRNFRATVAASIMAVVVGAGAISLCQLLLGSLLLPRFVVGVGAIALVPWYVVCTYLANAGSDRQALRDRIVAVVGSEEAATLRSDLTRRAAERPATLMGVLSPDQARPAPGRAAPLVDTVASRSANVVVLDRFAADDDEVVAQAASLHEAGVRVRTLALFYDEWLGKLPLSELERVSLMFDIGEIHRARYGRLKRLTDVTVALVGVALLVLALPFVLIGNIIANRGSLFYRQPRVGRGGETYEILKFRTMRPGADDTPWTQAADTRVTPFGRWLRVTHLDELPQVVNVLTSHQSIVGPRPEQPHYVEQLSEKIPFYDLRHLVKPGLTGWAQVKYDYGSSEVDALEKLQYEFYYLRHQSLSLDLRIIGRTLRSVIGRGGR